MDVLVFISYTTKDSNKFYIFKIAAKLTDYPEIDDVLYAIKFFFSTKLTQSLQMLKDKHY